MQCSGLAPRLTDAPAEAGRSAGCRSPTISAELHSLRPRCDATPSAMSGTEPHSSARQTQGSASTTIGLRRPWHSPLIQGGNCLAGFFIRVKRPDTDPLSPPRLRSPRHAGVHDDQIRRALISGSRWLIKVARTSTCARSESAPSPGRKPARCRGAHGVRTPGNRTQNRA
jgi:hypothetical protein